MTTKQLEEAKEHLNRLQAIIDSGAIKDPSARAAIRMEIRRLERELPSVEEKLTEIKDGRRAGRPSLRNRLKNLVVAILSQNSRAVKRNA